MVADELAVRLAGQFVRPNQTVLDPFCGSGRLLTAACSVPGMRIGVDVNPLACLISRAKFADVDLETISSIEQECGLAAAKFALAPPLKLGEGRKVEWFSGRAAKELGEIVAWINGLNLRDPERLLVAASLSAVAREVSFARKLGWKLHRMGETARAQHAPAAWELLQKRLSYCIGAVSRESISCSSQIFNANSTDPDVLSEWREKVDLVITSPPYGDSRTTVQYGAASELCLEVVSHLRGFEGYASQGGKIDSSCLGGSASDVTDERLSLFWSGRGDSVEARNAARFLGSLTQACATVSQALRPGGQAVFVVGRRSTGGYRLRLDEFLCDEMSRRGFNIELVTRRSLKWKRAPQQVNRFAKSASAEKRASGLLPTMKDEIILAFQRPVPFAHARAGAHLEGRSTECAEP